MKRKKNSMRFKIAIAGITLTLLLTKTGLPALSNIDDFWQQCSTRLALNVPTRFGKTHFILGYPHTDDGPQGAKKQQAVEPKSSSAIQKQADSALVPSAPEHKGNVVLTPRADGHVRQVLFSPDDDVRAALLQLIDQEQTSIKIAIFSFTDRDVAQALARARQRGVAVEVITDNSCLQGKYNKIELLYDNGVPIFVYNLRPARRNVSGIMHHKFALFGNTLGGKTLAWTGSFNFTRSAHRENQENVIVLDDAACIQRYTDQFGLLKRRSERYIVA